MVLDGLPLPYPVIRINRYGLDGPDLGINGPGVYFLEGIKGLLYVGQSQNVLKRLKVHRDGWHLNTLLDRHAAAAAFAYWEATVAVHVMVTKMYEQLAIEAAFITLTAPPINKKEYGSGDREAALELLKKFCSFNAVSAL